MQGASFLAKSDYQYLWSVIHTLKSHIDVHFMEFCDQILRGHYIVTLVQG